MSSNADRPPEEGRPVETTPDGSGIRFQCTPEARCRWCGLAIAHYEAKAHALAAGDHAAAAEHDALGAVAEDLAAEAHGFVPPQAPQFGDDR